MSRRILCKYSRTERSDRKEYIQEQEKDDIAKDKLSVKEYEDPFGEDKEIKKKNPNKK